MTHVRPVLSALLTTVLFTAASFDAYAAPPKPRAARSQSGGSSRSGGSSGGAGNPTIPDDGRVCIGDRYQGKKVTIRDHRGQPLRCKIEVAKHNLAIAKASSDKDTALGYQAALARLDVEQAMTELQAAAAGQRAAAEAKLNKALDAADKMDEQLAARAKSIADKTRAQLEQRVADLKKQVDAATGKAKQELQAKYLKAQQAAKRIDEKLASLDVAAAQAKLDSAMKRVGDRAKALQADAKAKVDAAKQKYVDVKKKVDAAIADIKKQIDALQQQLKAVVEDAEQALQDAEESLDDLTEGLDELF